MLLTRHRTTRTTSRAVLAATGLVVAGSLVALGAAPASAAKAPKAPKAPKVVVTAGDTKVYAAAGAPGDLPADVRTGVLATLTTYLRTTATATKSPADADAALTPLLTTTAAARLSGTDRGTLLDEGLPAATGKVTVAVAPVPLTALTGDGGAVVLVTAGVDATTTVPTKAGKVAVHRTGTLVLTPVDGTWKIQGYELAVQRSGRKLGAVAGTPVTTVPAAPAPTTPGTVAK